MKDGMRTAEHVEVSRQEVYEDYVNYYLQQCTDDRLCRDEDLLKKVARYLLREPEPRGTFTVFPFDQALIEYCGALSPDCRKLSAFIKAVEILETICVNLFLQPWKKEIKTLKTFTGPFVYCLLPVFNRSTIQSVLASIGYLPHTETPQSEYRLSEDANPDRAMLVGFELLVARVECYHLQELLDKEQLAPQEWLKVLQRRGRPMKLEEPTEKKTSIGQKEEEEKKKEEAEGKKEPPYLDSRFTVNPQPKPQHCPLTEDQSIMEMQNTYPDLAFRGRPLLPSKPHRAHACRSSCKAIQTASTNNYSNDIKAAELPTRDCNVAVTTSIRSKTDAGKAAEVFGDDSRSPGFADTDRSRVDDKLSHALPASLHITLKAGSTAGQRLKPGEPQPTAEPLTWAQPQTAADKQNKRPDSPGLSSLTEDQQLRELAESMGHLHVHETKEEWRGKGEHKRGQENTNKERRRKERKTSTEREAEEQNLRRPVMETGPVLSHARCSRPSQCDPAVMREQKQPTVSPLPAEGRLSEV
uniref:uncharacterized protein si:ch211-189a15.5 n=1 Tax=Scatophagus argus TaxID=75038 RepID=UPI001ED83C42|nr:uncharacterized protein si:ch211-189a15.5 [Scatophagus argus]